MRRPKNFRARLRFERLESRQLLAADFLSFNAVDASGDDSPLTTFELSAIAVSYDFDPDGGTLLGVDFFARQGDTALKIGEHSGDAGTDLLLSLDGFDGLNGSWEFYATARMSDGARPQSGPAGLSVLPTDVFSGGLTAETFTYNTSADIGSVYYGGGGTDTLSLSVPRSAVASLNGLGLDSHSPNSLVGSQAIYAGSAFDFLRLNDGSEIYLQGIERLEFSSGSPTVLQTTANDPRFQEHWHLAVADVTDAWRFSRGSDEVLLVSIDTGIPISGGVATFADLDGDRLAFEGNASGSSHGHQAVSVMAATPNNNEGVTGLNWESPVLVLDVYGGDAGNIGINTAINTALAHRDSIGASRIVFQGGIQGEYWLNVLQGGLIPSIEEEALFAMAAGNGGQDISITSHPDGLSGGIARLEGVHENVIATGALLPSGFQVHDGLRNVSGVSLASYSNFGENLTFAAPTNVPAEQPDGGNGTFTGTSAANPVMAGYSSLVWSVAPQLTAGEVRQILAETATDAGAPGRDTTYGHGVPNVGAAVRRAWAQNANPELANLGENPLSEGPDMPGDFNLDGVIDAADYTVWRDSHQTAVVQFTGADANGDAFVDDFDRAIWAANYGARIVANPLINATLGNGEFAVDDAADVSLFGGGSDTETIALNRDRAFRNIGQVGRGIAVDGWEIERVSYSGGNAAFGVDGNYGFATDAGEGPGQTGQAFANSGVIEVRSDTIGVDLREGERVTLSYLLGSDADGATATVEGTATLVFNAGLPDQFTHSFDTRSATGLDTPAINEEYILTADVSSLSVNLLLDGRVTGKRTLLDGVELTAYQSSLRVEASPAQAATSSAAVALVGQASETSADVLLDAFPSSPGDPTAPTAIAPIAIDLAIESTGEALPGAIATSNTPTERRASDHALLLIPFGSVTGDSESQVPLDETEEAQIAELDEPTTTCDLSEWIEAFAQLG